VKKSFTLIEALFVIVILAFVLVGGFQILGKLYTRNYIVKKSAFFESVTQQTLDQLSSMLYYRIPLSVIGYNPQKGVFKYIGEIEDDENFTVVEWIGYLNDAMHESNLSGFADLYASKKPVLKAVDFNSDFVNEVLHNKYSTSDNLENLCAVVFAGSFDSGVEDVLSDYNNSFGWHSNRADFVYRISSANQDGGNCDLNLSRYDGGEIGDIRIYEKFYLADSAYAVALKKDLKKSDWNCDTDYEKFEDGDLLLFYNYRPWKGETFCGDGGEGNVTLFAQKVKSFKIKKINSHLELKIQMTDNKLDINVTVSKQKVTF